MNQEQIAIELQHKADQGNYAHQGELAKDCFKLGASYTVLAWLDKYCLTRNLYTETNELI